MKTELRKRVDDKTDIVFIRKDGKEANVGLTFEELIELWKQINVKLGKLTANEYQAKAKSTCLENSYSYSYLGNGLVEELGEFTGKIAKMVRKGVLPINFTQEDVKNLPEESMNELKKELGDIQWFVAVMADWFGWTLQSVQNQNIEKLADRVKRDKIDGEGDNR